jgi:hypothetical protein
MKLFLQRESKSEHDTIGSMSIDGVYFCKTLEPAQHDHKIKGVTRIPAGTYRLEMHMSPMLGRVTPQLINVPGFEHILIHNGNTFKDTHGCILIGSKLGDFSGNRAVLMSRETCVKLEAIIFPLLEKKEEVTIQILDEQNS